MPRARIVGYRSQKTDLLLLQPGFSSFHLEQMVKLALVGDPHYTIGYLGE